MNDFNTKRRLFFRIKLNEFEKEDEFSQKYYRMGNLTLFKLNPIDKDKFLFNELVVSKTIYNSL